MSSSNTTERVLRSQDIQNDVYLLGSIDFEIRGAKLPSIRQVLKVFFYLFRHVNLDQRESARLAVREAFVFWNKARIPLRQEQHCIDKLLAIYNEWNAIRKSKSRRNETQETKERAFIDKLDNLFDVAHDNAMEIITNQEDKEFLMKQRRKGRPGCMIGVDSILATKERNKAVLLEKKQLQKEKHDAEIAKQFGKCQLFHR